MDGGTDGQTEYLADYLFRLLVGWVQTLQKFYILLTGAKKIFLSVTAESQNGERHLLVPHVTQVFLKRSK